MYQQILPPQSDALIFSFMLGMDFYTLSCVKQHLASNLAPLMLTGLLTEKHADYSNIAPWVQQASVFTAILYSRFQDHRPLRILYSSSILILSPQYDK